MSRRTFVKGLAIGGAAASFGLLRSPGAWADVRARQPQATLSGSEFDLTIGETPVNLTGRERLALTVNGSLPGPTLRWKEGDTVTLRVANTLREEASIHWHGILLPANMDGVPGSELPRHPPRRDVYVSIPRPSGGHLLVSQPLRLH